MYVFVCVNKKPQYVLYRVEVSEGVHIKTL